MRHHHPLVSFANIPVLTAWPLIARPVSPPRRYSQDQLKLQAREQLEGLIKKHGHPTVICSSSSLRSLTSTSPTEDPSYLPSPELHPITTTVDSPDTFCLRSSGTRPIPIPKAASTRDIDDVPVTPLTGRFDEVHFLYGQQCPQRSKDQKPATKKRNRRPRVSQTSISHGRMHSDGSAQLYTPSSMAQSGRSISPQNSPKGAPGISLGGLPRFHPAVYQSSTGSHNSSSRPSSPHQRPQTYRVSPGSRDTLRQYRELVTNGILSRNAQGVITTKPAAPRLDPLGSPGPVTPLVLEEGDSYLSAGFANGSDQSSGSMKNFTPSPELVERLIQRENERIRLQKHRQGTKGQ